jgi:predicted RNase H-like nuclease (RuvC/YqgF family)
MWTVLVTAFTVLFSTSAWRYYENRARKKERDEDFIRRDCSERITKLEALLTQSSKEKEEMRITILHLTEQVSSLAVKVEFLQKENSELHRRLSERLG